MTAKKPVPPAKKPGKPPFPPKDKMPMKGKSKKDC